ncbi:hypothetical protein ERO13_A08G171550v2, partial [Gossypium hirsutum]
ISDTHVNTILGSSKLIEGSGRAIILLPKCTKFFIADALYSTNSQINLLSFKDIRLNGYHIETMNEKNMNIYILQMLNMERNMLERLLAFLSGLYYTHVSAIKTRVTTN